jgi:hypothetical protein
MSRGIHGRGVVGPGVQAAVDDVGEVGVARAAGFARGLAFADLLARKALASGWWPCWTIAML